jgi:hypothetical protein
VPVFGVGEQEETPYYVMQFIRGQGLDAVLDELTRLRAVNHSKSPAADGEGESTAGYTSIHSDLRSHVVPFLFAFSRATFIIQQ